MSMLLACTYLQLLARPLLVRLASSAGTGVGICIAIVGLLGISGSIAGRIANCIATSLSTALPGCNALS
jgi:hypothetical protein